MAQKFVTRKKEKSSQNPYLVPSAIILAGMIIAGAILVSRTAGQLGSEAVRQLPGQVVEQEVEEATEAATPEEGQVAGVVEEPKKTIGNFLVTEEEICEEGGKPIIYYFGSSQCPHCTWEHPIMEKVLGSFAGQVSFHDLMDDTSGRDNEIFEKYLEINRGAIPFLVFGCKYVRVGSGESIGRAEEEKVLTALTCKLTGGTPRDVCEPLRSLIEQVE